MSVPDKEADLVDLEVAVEVVAREVAAAVVVGKARMVEVAGGVAVVWGVHADCCHSLLLPQLQSPFQ